MLIAISIFVFLPRKKASHADILTNSLPITRKTIVVACYLTFMVIAMIGTAVWLLLTYLSILINSNIGFDFQQVFTFKLGFIFLFIFLIQVSLIFPMFFRLGTFSMVLIFFSAMLIPIVFNIKVPRLKSKTFVPFGLPSTYGQKRYF